MPEDIHGLVGRCIRRDERAWEKFIELFSGLLYYSARKRLRRNGIAFAEHDIEDIVQGVFLEIWEKARLQEVRERKKISGWLGIMAQTRALNYMRRKKERLLRREEFYRMDNVVSDAAPLIEEDLISEFEKAMEGFEAREKIIFKLNVIHGKSHREIAGFMNMPINTVSTVIARKKKALKEILNKF